MAAGAAAVANLPCFRAEALLSHLEELGLSNADFSFNFLVFFFLREAVLLLIASKSAVIMEVSASAPKPSCPICPESRELRLAAYGGETIEAGRVSIIAWGGGTWKFPWWNDGAPASPTLSW